MGLRRVLGFMLSLFDFSDVDNYLQAELRTVKLKKGILFFFLGIFMFLLTSFLLTAMSIIYLAMVYDATSAAAIVVSAKPAITTGFLISSLIYYGLITFPYLFLGSFLHQGITFFLMKVLGRGKGTYAQQYAISSYITLMLGMGSLLIVPIAVLSLVLPCFMLFFVLVYLLAAIYLSLFVQAKMLVAVHKVDFNLAIAVALLVSIGSLVAYLLLQLLVARFGMFPDFTATYPITGINNTAIGFDVPGLPNISFQVPSLPNATNASNASATGLGNLTNATNTT